MRCNFTGLSGSECGLSGVASKNRYTLRKERGCTARLLHGHWLDSLRYNVLLVPTLIWLGTLFFIRDKTVFLRVLTAGVAVLALFTVARNIPLS